MVRSGKLPLLNFTPERGKRSGDHRISLRILPCVPEGTGGEPDNVVQYKHLPVAVPSAADTDDRNRTRFSNDFRNLFGDFFYNKHGGSDQLGELTAGLVGDMMDRYPNLYMSLRPVPAPSPVLNKLFTPRGVLPDWNRVFTRHADRFVIGNDCFFVPPGIKGGGAPIEFSQGNEWHLRAMRVFLNLLPPELARKIAYENAARIYKLGQP